MFKKIVDTFIKPPNRDIDLQAREFVRNCILIGIIGLCLVNALNSLFSLIIKHELYVFWRFTFISFLLVFFISIYLLAKHKSVHKYVSIAICSLFFGLATYVLVRWGLQDPIAASLYCLVVVMAGILIGARYSLYVVVMILITFLFLLMLDTKRVLHPDTGWTDKHISLGDAVSFVTIFAVIALVSWLFNRNMEHALKRAHQSEEALRKQRDNLEFEVKERTRQLQAEQIEKVQQVYRFAELGHLSTALFHDLANFSTSLTLDAEGLKENNGPDIVRRVQKNIKYINDVVKRVNLHLQNRPLKEKIDVIKLINDIIGILGYEANKRGVRIKLNSEHLKILFRTDTTRFRQLITNLISNAIEAYDNTTLSSPKTKKEVVIDVIKSKKNITVMVKDHGKGIPKSKIDKIFEPFYSGKSNGTGIGLFIVQQVAEKDLGGTINVVSNKKEGTIFTVVLPYIRVKSTS